MFTILSKNQELSNADFSPHTTLHYFLALLSQSKVQEFINLIKDLKRRKKTCCSTDTGWLFDWSALKND